MSVESTAPKPQKIALPDIPAMVVNAKQAYMLSDEGEIKTLPEAQAKALIHKKPVLVCHAPYMRGRLNDADFYAFDVLELFAFVHPAKFCVPTPHGLAAALGIAAPESMEDAPFTLVEIARALLSDLQSDPWSAKAPPLEIAQAMGMNGLKNGGGWPWTPFVCAALEETYEESVPVPVKKAMGVWKNLPEWAEEAPEPPPSHHGVSAEEAQARLENLLGHGAEQRTEQVEYAKMMAGAFMPLGLDPHPDLPPIRGKGQKDGAPSPYEGEGWGEGQKPRYSPEAKEHIEFAREQRKQSPEAEQLLWTQLRNKALEAKFRRQHPVGQYTVDFVCLEKKLIIEVDGYSHDARVTYDEKREKDLKQQEGFEILRFRNEDVLENLEGVVQTVQAELAKDPPPNPPPPGGGDDNSPHVVLSEAGTGVGKTLGYLAPASVWAEKNKGTVWISTYTKNLQRQIDQELDRVYPNPALKEAHVAVRKGRENYLCLLNLEDAVAAVPTARSYQQAVAAGIMARWAAASKDGDLSGADFPGWLSGILGYQQSLGLADRRGECIYSACDHYSKCFVEHSVRKAKRARLVVANHALVMINAALSSPGEDMPSRYIFDEGHHLFDAADSAYAAHLTARETRDLRRWLLGAEGGKRSRARGIKRRAEDLCEGMADAEKALQAIMHEAECLSAKGWTRRFKDANPKGPCEDFLMLVYRQVFARAKGSNGPYSLETEAHPVDPAVLEKAKILQAALEKLQTPMQDLAKIFRKKLADDDGALDSDTRKRLDAVAGSLERRAIMSVGAWSAMLESLNATPPPCLPRESGDLENSGERSPIKSGTTNPSFENEKFIDWMEVERIDGRAIDVGLYRHNVDPMKPFADSIKPHVHGMAVTSATLRDSSDEEHWETAIARTGANYLTNLPPPSREGVRGRVYNPADNTNMDHPHPNPPPTGGGGGLHMAGYDSPFDYGAQTKIFIINDVRKDDLVQVSGAYRALFEASGGGALGLFTAISRLRAVHERIAPGLEENGLPLYSQHVDEIDPGTLVDMFRDDTHACLLGTDAIRDGVDVPGESLRLIVFDRVPWPRPTILHKARREAFGGRKYDEMITRLKLKQAFGRLIRRGGDKGVFVMLDNMLPSRLQNAFPPEAEVQKVGLAEAVAGIKGFLG